MTDEDEQSTRLSDGHVLDRFLAAIAASPSLTVMEFFDKNPNVDRARYLVVTIVADVQRRTQSGLSVSPRTYFQQFAELASHADAWKILEAAQSSLIASEGPDWAVAWGNDYPDATLRFKSQLPLFDSPFYESAAVVSGDVNLDDLQPGDRLLDFKILRFVGEGTFGRVYLAIDRSLDRQCALKVTIDQGSEGQVLARLNHPGIIHVYREQTLQGRKFLAMQFVDGQSLSDWIRDSKKQGDHSAPHAAGSHVREAVRMVREIATSLKHAHVRGVLHRDIKPANILIDQTGRPMLSDFNVATASNRGGRFTVGGTVNYMSPEQLQAVCLNDASAEESVDIRSDIYSLGVVLLEAITGQKTWSMTDATSSEAAINQLLAARIRSGPPSIAGHPGVSPSLSAIVQKSLQPIADNRYQSSAEIETDLTQWLGNRDNAFANNPSIAERMVRRIRRHRNWWAGNAIASVLLLTVLAYGYIADNRLLDRCDELAQQTKTYVKERNVSRASKSLGQANAQLQQIRIAGWFHPDHYQAVTKSLSESSQRVSVLEAQRFTSLFGEITLREVHQNQPPELTGLIEDSLRVYKVMSTTDWQKRSPFIDLSAIQQESVAEGITELMVMSMHQSASKAKPTAKQIWEVRGRLPVQHKNFALFETIAETRQVNIQRYEVSRALDPFEAYLCGVLATMEQDHDLALRWYAHALRDDSQGKPARFWCHYRYAFTCQKLKLHERAFIHYGICLGLQPDFAWPKFNMGLACLDVGKPSLAETYIRKAIQVDPEFIAAYVALIALQTQQGNYEAALTIYNEATSHGLSSPELINNRKIAQAKLATRRKAQGN